MIKMFAKESLEDHNREPNKRDIDEDEEEETLSFYEFSINSEADAWEDSSKESSQNSSFKSSEQEEEEEDYFEFFSEELKKDTHKNILSQPENIIFCGKIIPYKQPIVPENPKNTVKEKKRRRRGFFRWRWNFTSSYKSRTSGKIYNEGANHPCTTSNAKNDLQPESPKQKHSTRKRSQIQGFPVHKMSIFTSMTKSRWYLYLFGITRFRSEMELRDMKNRQSRRSPSITLSRLESSNEDWERKGAWRLLRALSCGGGGDQEANAVVQASVINRIPGV